MTGVATPAQIAAFAVSMKMKGPNSAEVTELADTMLLHARRVPTRAIHDVTGRQPRLSTSGGTSDARFIKDACPVVEIGLVGASMHAVDEYADVSDLEELSRIYERTFELYFGGNRVFGPSATNAGIDALPGDYELVVTYTALDGTKVNRYPLSF